MKRNLPPEDSSRLWNLLHAETDAEADAIRQADGAVTPDLIEQMRQAREQMGKKKES